MNKQETANGKRAAGVGFITYMLVTAVNYFYYVFTEQALLSPTLIFWSGLAMFFAYDLLLTIKEKRLNG